MDQGKPKTTIIWSRTLDDPWPQRWANVLALCAAPFMVTLGVGFPGKNTTFPVLIAIGAIGSIGFLWGSVHMLREAAPKVRRLHGWGISFLTIITVLFASILTPILQSAKEASRTTGRVSNIKQMATAMAIYGADYDDHLPMRPNWRDALEPYHNMDDLAGDKRSGWLTMNAFAFDMTIEQRAKCVLLYYSTQSGPNPIGAGADPFWLEGKEVVAFGDTSSDISTKEEFGALPWRADQREAKP